MPVPLEDLLIEAKLVTPEQLNEALDYRKANGGELDGALVDLGLVTDEQIAALLSRRFRVPFVDLPRLEIDSGAIERISPATAVKYRAVPLDRRGATLRIAMADPANVAAIDDIAFMTGCNVEPVVATGAAVAEAIRKHYGGDGSRPEADARRPDPAGNDPGGLADVRDDDIEVLQETDDADAAGPGRQGDEAPVVRLVNLLLASAVDQGASDVHVEPYEQEIRVRFRVDGVLRSVMTPPLKLREAIASRLKVMARLDIAEKRLPQDGRLRVRFRARAATREIDLRVSCLPTLFGEKVVLRLLDPERLTLEMTRLGFDDGSLARYEAGIRSPWGMVLVTGPTGSGKTNTLYSSIARLNTPGVNVMTAEDPVEFNLRGVNQVQIREPIGLTFAAALRSLLRQDPDVILVGEIRDPETAEVAVKAALTGHLVLSTLHTNDAPSTVTRLRNMGVEPFLVAGSVRLVCAQRLVRRICAHCSQPAPMTPDALIDVGFSEHAARRAAPRIGRGCGACRGTGYKGRVGLFEVMAMSPALRELVLAGASVHELGRQARDEGMATLRQSGLRKIADGVTTVEEVVRETGP